MKVKQIEVIPVQIPVDDRVRIRDAYGWKTDSRYNIVRITDENGNIGLGEATFTDVWSGERLSGSKEVIENVLFPAIRDCDIFDIVAALRNMDKAIYGHLSSKAAVEMALFDLMGKALNVPLYKLLGGRIRERVPIKFSISAVSGQDLLKAVEFALERGIRTVKIKVGMGRQADIERVKAVYEAFGSELRIAVDANNAWRLEEAKYMLDRLAAFDLLFVEQPLSRDELRDWEELRRFTSLPLVVDEGVFTPEQAWQALSAGVADVYSVYPGKNGGIVKTVRILNMVQSAKKIGLLGSNLELGIASAAMAHVGVSNESVDDLTYPSDIIGPLYHKDDILATPLPYEPGAVRAPEGAGLGVELDENKLEFYRIH